MFLGCGDRSRPRRHSDIVLKRIEYEMNGPEYNKISKTKKQLQNFKYLKTILKLQKQFINSKTTAWFPMWYFKICCYLKITTSLVCLYLEKVYGFTRRKITVLHWYIVLFKFEFQFLGMLKSFGRGLTHFSQFMFLSS